VKKSFVIGISGSIGSGKSLVRHLLALRGVLTIDADELTHFLLTEGKAGYAAVLQHFGGQILAENGKVDRARLSKIVFNDPLELQILEKTIHPLVTEALQAILQNTACPLVAVEAIKLYDSDLVHAVDSRWFVNSTVNSQMERLLKTRGMNQREITERLNQQSFSRDLKIDHFIDNSRRISDTWEQVDLIWREMAQNHPEFKTAQEKLSNGMPGLILDLPKIKHIKAATGRQIDKVLQKEKGGSLEETVLSSRVFLTPLDSEDAYLIWRFDHFNTFVEGISRNGDEKNFLTGLVELENITKFWGGNCLVVHLANNSGLLEKSLSAQGYLKLSSLDEHDFSFLMCDPLIEGTIETHWVKPMTGGIWRLIP
jgi:dephospho-CoA kinase